MKPFAIDLDDVIGVLKNALYTSLSTRFPHVRPPEFWTSFSLVDLYGITLKQFLDAIVDDGLLSSMPVAAGALEALNAIKDSGIPIVIITSRGYHPDAYAVTKAWLELNCVPYDDLIIVPEGMTKAQAAADRYPSGFLYMIDDYPKNLDDMRAAGLVSRTILISQPWNRTRSDYKQGVSRFDSINGFITQLKEHAYKTELVLPERIPELTF